MSKVFDIETLRDARQYLEGAYVPRVKDGLVCYVERIYSPNDRDSADNLRCLYSDGREHHEVDDPLEFFDFEAVPTLGLVPDGGIGAVYTTISTSRQWKKAITSARVQKHSVSPYRHARRVISLEQARFMFSPKYDNLQAAVQLLDGIKVVVPLSSEVYVATTPAGIAVGYKTNLVGKLDSDRVAHLHPRAAALKEIISDYMTVGGTL